MRSFLKLDSPGSLEQSLPHSRHLIHTCEMSGCHVPQAFLGLSGIHSEDILISAPFLMGVWVGGTVQQTQPLKCPQALLGQLSEPCLSGHDQLS